MSVVGGDRDGGVCEVRRGVCQGPSRQPAQITVTWCTTVTKRVRSGDTTASNLPQHTLARQQAVRVFAFVCCGVNKLRFNIFIQYIASEKIKRPF